MWNKLKRNKGTIIAFIPAVLMIFVIQLIERSSVCESLVATIIIFAISIPVFLIGIKFANYAMNKWDEK